ncbi:hypothetical protein PoB_000600700 [Plakobranchus ocellatus]|uniref:Uncharacterized protein n=1 Tax=Plakobranchus ocellatus TaxID=259542 RepID=A0AAV3Y9M7_9GAST|nr:hypothetical protein PoB_000600700 [Plakobranchus ocellatus]
MPVLSLFSSGFCRLVGNAINPIPLTWSPVTADNGHMLGINHRPPAAMTTGECGRLLENKLVDYLLYSSFTSKHSRCYSLSSVHSETLSQSITINLWTHGLAAHVVAVAVSW